MKFTASGSSSICEICKKHKSKGDHSACSKKKQLLRAEADAKKKKKPRVKNPKTYQNERQLTNFLKMIE